MAQASEQAIQMTTPSDMWLEYLEAAGAEGASEQQHSLVLYSGEDHFAQVAEGLTHVLAWSRKEFVFISKKENCECRKS